MPVPDKIARRGSYANHQDEFPESVQKLRERDPLAFDLHLTKTQLQTARMALLHVKEIFDSAGENNAHRHNYDPNGCNGCLDIQSELIVAAGA